jgi:hypothetical protein
MLRISLIIAVVAGIAALAISQLKVAKDLEELRTELTTTKESLTASQSAETTAKRAARDATAAADKAKKELDTTKTDLANAAEKADQQEKRAIESESRLNKTLQERNDAQTELARWKAVNRSVEEILAMVGENRKLITERDGVANENKVLARKITVIQSELDLLKGVTVKVELPSGLQGKVIAVDPKYEFVVLDIGEKDGVLRRGEMLVNRSGRLVAKVRILTVEANRSVANVLSDWKNSEILEGDVVLVGL